MFLIACWLAVGGKTQEGDGKGLCGVFAACSYKVALTGWVSGSISLSKLM